VFQLGLLFVIEVPPFDQPRILNPKTGLDNWKITSSFSVYLVRPPQPSMLILFNEMPAYLPRGGTEARSWSATICAT
jgi:hypothetical protein